MMLWHELPQILRVLSAMLFVLALMGGLYAVMRRLNLNGLSPGNAAAKRLKVLESLPLDARRRLVLIQRDDKQHLVILGPNGETVVETNIKNSAEEKNIDAP